MPPQPCCPGFAAAESVEVRRRRQPVAMLMPLKRKPSVARPDSWREWRPFTARCGCPPPPTELVAEPGASDESLRGHGLSLFTLRAGRTHPPGGGQDGGPIAATALRWLHQLELRNALRPARLRAEITPAATRCLLECDVDRPVWGSARRGRPRRWRR